VLKNRLTKEGSQTVTNCNQLKMQAEDGKQRLTDAANAETLLRLVQSVPSPKAEPIKLWLAKVGYERMQEMSDPARALERARATWQKHGRSDKWIQQRMTGQETRNKLTDYWATHDINSVFCSHGSPTKMGVLAGSHFKICMAAFTTNSKPHRR
jgi:DNA-damage-inducible protein D